ncbi:hypothetical protein C8Q78DRAFT_677857 [Trametes maxima]|nr:hypothetical protein C8Q78DRAFT_677857 [Trametes maxima]
MNSTSQALHDVYQFNQAPCSFQPFVYPCDRQFPIYAHCNSQRKRKTHRLRCNTAYIAARPKDLMQSVDYRYAETQTRSSFALSDIFETDEEGVEIEISPVLPTTPNTANSVSTTKSTKARVKALFMGVLYSVRGTWGLTHSIRQ